MAEFGDLSGIIHEVNSDELITGNQRSKIIDIENAEIKLIKTFKTPTKNGTVAYGYIIYGDERFNYRRVDWTTEQCERANVIANKVHI